VARAAVAACNHVHMCSKPRYVLAIALESSWDLTAFGQLEETFPPVPAWVWPGLGYYWQLSFGDDHEISLSR